MLAEAKWSFIIRDSREGSREEEEKIRQSHTYSVHTQVADNVPCSSISSAREGTNIYVYNPHSREKEAKIIL